MPIYEPGLNSYILRNVEAGWHGADGGSLSFSIGSTLVQSAADTWNATVRHMEINRQGAPNTRHTLNPKPQELVEPQLARKRESRYGRFYAGIGFSYLDDLVSAQGSSEVTGFMRWSLR